MKTYGLLTIFLLMFSLCRHTPQPVSLNQGQRWLANPETTAGIKEMLMAIEQASTGTQYVDYRALHQRLEEAFQNIFKQCTMQGEAHNQLHNYLLPMKDLFAAIKDSPDQSQAVEDLENYLLEYKRYFE